MKLFHKLIIGGLSAIIALFVFAIIGLGHASAACVQYDANATTPTTPVFNNICGVPNGIGDEPDFVRVRKSTNGNNIDNINNPKYTNVVTDDCKAGNKYDVWTYVHNNAVSAYNDNGAGSAVAHNTMLALSAALNATNTNFNFMSSVSASNATGVQDNATLNCGSHQVKLTLVPSTVHMYSQQFNWQNLADGTVNSTTKIGSPTQGSGDLWGCWEYRIVVVYQVTVSEPPVIQKPSTASCKAVDVTISDGRKLKVNVTGQVDNAQIIGYEIDFDDGTKVNQQTAEHTYAKDGTYNVVSKVQAKFADGHTEWLTAVDCTKKVVIKSPEPPVTTVKPVPPVPTVPEKLPDTGVGNIVGIFTGVSMVGAVMHKRFMVRKAAN